MPRTIIRRIGIAKASEKPARVVPHSSFTLPQSAVRAGREMWALHRGCSGSPSFSTFGTPKDDPGRKIVTETLEAVFHAGFDEDHVARSDWTHLPRFREGAESGVDNVELVLAVRLLRVPSHGPKQLDAHRSVRHPDMEGLSILSKPALELGQRDDPVLHCSSAVTISSTGITEARPSGAITPTKSEPNISPLLEQIRLFGPDHKMRLWKSGVEPNVRNGSKADISETLNLSPARPI